MKITKVTFEPFADSPVTYDLGKKIKFGDTALTVKDIALEPTGQVVLELSGGNIVLYGNTPYRLEALVDAAQSKEEKKE